MTTAGSPSPGGDDEEELIFEGKVQPSMALTLMKQRRNMNQDDPVYNLEHVSPLSNQPLPFYASDKRSLIKNNLGSLSFSNKIFETFRSNQKILQKVFWTTPQIVDFVKAKSRGTISTSNSPLPKSEFVQRRKFKFFSLTANDKEQRKYKRYQVMADCGRDYFSPTIFDSQFQIKKHKVEITEVFFSSDLSQQGSIPTVYLPVVGNLSKQTINVVPALTIIKTIYTLHQACRHLDSSTLQYRQIKQCSKWGTIDHQFKDINLLGTSEGLSDLKRINTEKYTHFFVPKGKEKQYARLAFLLTLYKTPFYIENQTSSKQPILAINNYEDSVLPDTFFWYTENGSVMNSEVINMNTLWTGNLDEFEEIVQLFKRLIPHKKSAQIADQVIFSANFLSYAEEQIGDNFVKQMPFQVLPIYIGLLEVNQPQNFGYHPISMAFTELIATQMLKEMQLELAVSVIALSIKQSILNKNNTKYETGNKTLDETIENEIIEVFQGSWQSDCLWHLMFDNVHTSVFNMFYPNIMKQLFLSKYNNFRDSIKNDTFILSDSVQLSAYSTMVNLDVNPYTLAFRDGICIDFESKNKTAIFKSNTDTIDFIDNIIGNTTSPLTATKQDQINITDHKFTSELKSKNDLYFIKNQFRSLIAADCHSVVIKLDQEQVQCNMFGETDLNPKELVSPNITFKEFTPKKTTLKITNVQRVTTKQIRKTNSINEIISRITRWSKDEQVVRSYITQLLELKQLLDSTNKSYVANGDGKEPIITIVGGPFDEDTKIKAKAICVQAGISIIFVDFVGDESNDHEGVDNGPPDSEDEGGSDTE